MGEQSENDRQSRVDENKNCTRLQAQTRLCKNETPAQQNKALNLLVDIAASAISLGGIC